MENKLSHAFVEHLNQLLTSLSTPSQHYIVALSGGLDSVVLLHLLTYFRQLNPVVQLSAHNVNHGLSQNAGKWGDFCADLCQKLAVNFISSEVKLENKARTSLEALARDARYRCLKDKMNENDLILTGHHQDDQLETLLLALKRGSGGTGLQGVRVSQSFAEGVLLRPLLIFSRQQLTEYAQFYQLQWIEDESNQNTDFDRNFIRHQISPLLKQRWPAIAQSASRSAQLCQEQQSLLDEVAQQDLATCSSHCFMSSTLDISIVSQLSKARRNNVIRYWLKENKLQYPSSKQLSILWEEVALAEVGKQPKLQFKTESIQRYQGLLYIVPNKSLTLPESPVEWSGEQMLWLVEGRLGVDFSHVDPLISSQYQVTCCLRQHLDSQFNCQPVGRDKARSIKKLLHEYQVPPWLREQVVFIFIGDELAQAIGVWHCHRDQPLTMELAVYSK